MGRGRETGTRKIALEIGETRGNERKWCRPEKEWMQTGRKMD